MAEQKTKLPDINEIASMAKKLLGDVQTSIREIIEDYKAKHVLDEDTSTTTSSPSPDIHQQPIEPKPEEAQSIKTVDSEMGDAGIINPDVKPKVVKIKTKTTSKE